MKQSHVRLLAAGLLATLLTGCEPQEGTNSAFDRLVSVSESAGSSDKYTLGTSRVHVTPSQPVQDSGSLGYDDEPNHLDEGVRRGTVRKAGPITPEKFIRWAIHTQKLIECEIQLNRVRHQKRALKLVIDAEQQFIGNIEREKWTFQTNIETQLRIFERLKEKYTEELRQACLGEQKLRDELVTWERQNLSPKPFEPFEVEGVAMEEKPLKDIVSAEQLETLAERNITDSRSLALEFLLQPDALAKLFDVSQAEASRIIHEAAAGLSEEELESLEALADRIRQIPPGVFSPEQGREPL